MMDLVETGSETGVRVSPAGKNEAQRKAQRSPPLVMLPLELAVAVALDERQQQRQQQPKLQLLQPLQQQKAVRSLRSRRHLQRLFLQWPQRQRIRRHSYRR